MQRWAKITSAHLVEVRVVEPLGLPLTAYATESWDRERRFEVCLRSASLVDVNDDVVLGRFYVESMVSQWVCGGALLLW